MHHRIYPIQISNHHKSYVTLLRLVNHFEQFEHWYLKIVLTQVYHLMALSLTKSLTPKVTPPCFFIFKASDPQLKGRLQFPQQAELTMEFL